MAALLEKVRDHQKHPVLTEEERIAQFGIYTPARRRASLPTSQRNAPRPKQVDSRYDNNADIQTNPTRTTDDLELEDEEEGSVTGRQPIAINTRRGGNTNPPRTGGQRVTSNPQTNRSVWKVIFSFLSAVVMVLFVLYTVVFLLVAGWIALSNAWQYGQAHAASTQAVIDGKPITIITSNINHTIYVTIINKDGSAKMYTGATLDASAWNGDPGNVIATASVGKGQAPTITVSLVGNMNYLRPLFVRPQSSFTLVPDKQAGYKVVQS